LKPANAQRYTGFFYAQKLLTILSKK